MAAGNRERETPHMTIEAQSERIVEIASLVLALTCLFMAFGALSAWLLRARKRIKKPPDQPRPEILFLAEPQKTPASPIAAPSQQPQP